MVKRKRKIRHLEEVSNSLHAGIGCGTEGREVHVAKTFSEQFRFLSKNRNERSERRGTVPGGSSAQDTCVHGSDQSQFRLDILDTEGSTLHSCSAREHVGPTESP
jgi:hypothetical protein